MGSPSRQALLSTLSKQYVQVGITLIDTLADLEELVASKPDLVLLGMKFIPTDPALGMQDPNKIWISNYLEKNDIAHTGSDGAAHRLELNKPLAKQRVQLAGLSTSPFCVVKQGMVCAKDDISLKYPLFLKPTNRGGGQGVDEKSVVYNFDQLITKVESISNKYQSDTLVEHYLSGREFSVAILRNENSEGFSVMPVELITEADQQGHRILGSSAKASDQEQVVEIKDGLIRSQISGLALSAFKALGARDYGRIDIRLYETGRPQFLEANLIPSLIDNYGNFPKACRMSLGLDHKSMIFRIVQLALNRSRTSELGELYNPAIGTGPRLAPLQ